MMASFKEVASKPLAPPSSSAAAADAAAAITTIKDEYSIDTKNKIEINEEEDEYRQTAQDGKSLKRKCVDYHNPAVLDISSRLYRKATRSHTTRIDALYLQPHSSYIPLMGLPISRVSAPDPSLVYCTNMAHVTRAKNSSAVM